MQWKLPGTVLSVPKEQAENIEGLFRPMFLAGNIMLGQVAAITGLEPYMVQNWVKRGFLAPPEDKRYTLRQLCRVININMLRSVLPMEKICQMLSCINGQLDDESDDLIDDSLLYFLFVRLASCDPPEPAEAIAALLADYAEPVPGARQRIAGVLQVMLTAYEAACRKDMAEQQLEALLQG